MLTMTMDLSLLADGWDTWVAELKLIGAMCFGQAFKIVCTCWKIDNETEEPLRFPACLWRGPEKFRTIGSFMIVGLVFILPGQAFDTLMAFHWGGFPFGYLSLFILGFVADDIFVIFPAVVSAKLREFAQDKLGVTLNGKRRLPKDFPQ